MFSNRASMILMIFAHIFMARFAYSAGFENDSDEQISRQKISTLHVNNNQQTIAHQFFEQLTSSRSALPLPKIVSKLAANHRCWPSGIRILMSLGQSLIGGACTIRTDRTYYNYYLIRNYPQQKKHTGK